MALSVVTLTPTLSLRESGPVSVRLLVVRFPGVSFCLGPTPTPGLPSGEPFQGFPLSRERRWVNVVHSYKRSASFHLSSW